jgi:hypothetical protein
MTERKKKKHKTVRRDGVTDEHREEAWKRIQAAARKHGVELKATHWREEKAGKNR